MTYPMPVFTIKAKDKLALDTIARYRDLCLRAGLLAQAAEVEEAYEEFMVWQASNPERVKLPDHKHVPAGDLVAVDPEEKP